MENDVGFINRINEIAEIENGIKNWGELNIILFQGEGGIGKTRLLEHTRELYSESKRGKKKLVIVKTLDFDDPELYDLNAFQRCIATDLGNELFQEYNEASLQRLQMEMSGATPSLLAREEKFVQKKFLKCYKKIAKNCRLVLLVDTVEKIRNTELGISFVEFVEELENTLCILAGRDIQGYDKEFLDRVGKDNVVFCELGPFDDLDTGEYIEKKQASLQFVLDDGWKERILALASGRPLIIDLVLEWLSRKIPMPWLQEKTPEEIKLLSDTEREKIYKELVGSVGELRTRQDQLLWIMTLVWPLDKDMALQITQWSSDELEEAWGKMHTYTSIKQLPDGKLMVHDIVREMILEYLRPEIELEREKEWFSRAMEYLIDLRTKLRQELESLKKQEEDARTDGDTKLALEYFFEQEALERAIWIIDSQYFGYQILYDVEKGLRLFEEAFIRATTRYRYSYRAILVAQIQRLLDRIELSSDQMYRVNFRIAQYYLDSAQYETAKELLLTMTDTYEGDRLVELLIQLANVVIRLGKFEGGYEHFKQATSISRRHQLPNHLIMALNGWGWVCRLMGRVDEAKEHYLEALELTIISNDRKREAQLLNNLAYLFAFQGKFSESVRLCERALKVWQELEEDRGLGALYIVFAELHRRQEMYQLALDYNKKALDIFLPQNDYEWLSQTYLSLGSVKVLQENYQEGDEYLQKALSFGIAKDEASIMHWLGRSLFNQGKIAEARSYHQKGFEISKALPDVRYMLFDLWGMARIDLSVEDYDHLDFYQNEFYEYQRNWSDVFYPSAEGLLLQSIGDIALRSNINDAVDLALRHYTRSLPYIAEKITYGPFKLDDQLKNIEDGMKIAQVTSDDIKRMGSVLYDVWKDKELEAIYPGALLYFLQWKKGVFSDGKSS